MVLSKSTILRTFIKIATKISKYSKLDNKAMISKAMPTDHIKLSKGIVCLGNSRMSHWLSKCYIVALCDSWSASVLIDWSAWRGAISSRCIPPPDQVKDVAMWDLWLLSKCPDSLSESFALNGETLCVTEYQLWKYLAISPQSYSNQSGRCTNYKCTDTSESYWGCTNLRPPTQTLRALTYFDSPRW